MKFPFSIILFAVLVACCGSTPSFPCGTTEVLTADSRCIAAADQPTTIIIDNRFKCARDEVQTSAGKCKPAEQEFPCRTNEVLNERGDCLTIPTHGVISSHFLAHGRSRRVIAGMNVLLAEIRFRAVVPMVYTISGLVYDLQTMVNTKGGGGVMPSNVLIICELKNGYDGTTLLDTAVPVENRVEFDLDRQFSDEALFWVTCDTQEPPPGIGDSVEIAADLTGMAGGNNNGSSTEVIFAARNFQDAPGDYRDSIVIEHRQ